MKKTFLPIIATCLMVGCGDVAETAIQGAAEAIANKNSNKQTTPPPQQSVTEQPVQQVAPAQPIAQQPIEPIPSQPIEPQVQALPPKPAPQITEQVVRRRAYALTRYGGKVLVRSHPSRNGRKLGFLYDREDVYVVAITNHCETIDRLQGCWVKVVDANGLTGYSFGGYLQY